MSKFIVPNTFVAGTKAKAQEVNENFASIQDELEKKALKEGDKQQTFLVADAIENNHAMNKQQVSQLVESYTNATAKELNAPNLSLFPLSGNVDNDGNSNIVTSSGTELIFNVGTNYPNLIGNIQGELTQIASIENHNMSGFSDGNYNIFVDKNGNITSYANNIYIQAKKPTCVMNDIWVNTSICPNEIKIFNGTDFEVFDKILIAKVNITNSQISSISNIPFNCQNVTVTNHTHPAKVIEYYQNGSSWYRLWSDGWLEQGCYTTEIQNGTIALLKPYKSTDYYLSVGMSIYNVAGAFMTKATNSFTMQSVIKVCSYFSWYTCGFSA